MQFISTSFNGIIIILKKDELQREQYRGVRYDCRSLRAGMRLFIGKAFVLLKHNIVVRNWSTCILHSCELYAKRARVQPSW